jgi:hypothetical protein
MQGSISLFLNRSKIADFYTHNSHKVDKLYQNIENIQRNHFVFYVIEGMKNEKGEPKEDIQFEGEGKDKKPVLLPGKTMEEFNKEINDLMNTDIEIKF